MKSTISSDDVARLATYLFAPWLSSQKTETMEDDFRSFLPLIHLKQDDLVLLCLHAVLSIPAALPKSIRTWKHICSVIVSLNNDADQPLLRVILEKTSNSLTALLLALIFRVHSPDEQFTLLIRRLSALVATKNFYLASANAQDRVQPTDDLRLQQLTVESIFVKHRYDYLLEMITRRIVEANIPPAWLISASTDSKEDSFQGKYQSV